jgi:hypothetical protein
MARGGGGGWGGGCRAVGGLPGGGWAAGRWVGSARGRRRCRQASFWRARPSGRSYCHPTGCPREVLRTKTGEQAGREGVAEGWQRGGRGVAEGWQRGGRGVAEGWQRGGRGVAEGWQRGGRGVAEGWQRGTAGPALVRGRPQASLQCPGAHRSAHRSVPRGVDLG